MTVYINKQTKQYPMSEYDIRAANPNVSFSVPFEAPSEYVVVNYTSPTINYNPVIQFVVEDAPKEISEGVFEQAWKVVDSFKDYTDADGVLHTKEEQEAAAIARDEENKIQLNKSKASQLLSETDYVENPSVVDTSKSLHLLNASDFDEYRLALRAIAINPPVNVDQWPTKPKAIWSSQ